MDKFEELSNIFNEQELTLILLKYYKCPIEYSSLLFDEWYYDKDMRMECLINIPIEDEDCIIKIIEINNNKIEIKLYNYGHSIESDTYYKLKCYIKTPYEFDLSDYLNNLKQHDSNYERKLFMQLAVIYCDDETNRFKQLKKQFKKEYKKLNK